MSNSGSFHTGGGGGAGKANFQDISVTKYLDNASPILMLYCANGDHFPKAKLTVRKAGKTPLEYLIIDMKNVLITSVSTGGSGGEDRLTENVSLNFAQVKVSYKKQKAGRHRRGRQGIHLGHRRERQRSCVAVQDRLARRRSRSWFGVWCRGRRAANGPAGGRRPIADAVSVKDGFRRRRGPAWRPPSAKSLRFPG